MKKIHISSESLKHIGILLVAIALLFYAWGLYSFFDLDDDLHELSKIGDWSGGITAPLVGLAGFVMIYLSFREQSQALERSQKEVLFQNFENTFYRLLENYRNTVNQLQFSNLDNPDPEFFGGLLNDLRRSLNNMHTKQNLIRQFENFEPKAQKIDYYVRNVLFLLDFLHQRKPPIYEDNPMDPAHYLLLFGTQMDDNELGLLFYRLLCKEDALALRGRALCRSLRFFEQLGNRNFLLSEAHLPFVSFH